MKKRLKLIELLTVKNYSIVRAARNLGLNAQTARMIFKKYRETGEYYTKKSLKHKNQINLGKNEGNGKL